DFDADRREVLVGEHAVDESGHEAGLADREPAEQADLLLDHGRSFGWRKGEAPGGSTWIDARRLRCLSSSVTPAVIGSVRPTPRAETSSASKPLPAITAIATLARERLNGSFNASGPSESECPRISSAILRPRARAVSFNSFSNPAIVCIVASCP